MGVSVGVGVGVARRGEARPDYQKRTPGRAAGDGLMALDWTLCYGPGSRLALARSMARVGSVSLLWVLCGLPGRCNNGSGSSVAVEPPSLLLWNGTAKALSVCPVRLFLVDKERAVMRR